MPSPRHLWSGSWREESEQPPADAPDLPAPPGQPSATVSGGSVFSGAQTPPPPLQRGGTGASGTRRLVVGGVVAAVIGATAAGGYIIGHGGDTKKLQTTAALPALPAPKVNPRKGQTQAAAIYAAASPAVVSIRTSSGSGTGFLVRDTRTVATNAHVVDGSSVVTVRFGPEGRDITAQVTGIDASSDLAVVRLPEASAPANAKPLKLADSDQVRIGDEVVAIGNPFGLDRTLTQGIISGLARAIQAPNNYEIDDALQTDAAINPGNSGGPLLDDAGQVIGVNSQIETGGGSNGNVGIGFSVSSNTVRQVIPALAKGQTIARAWLGISSQPAANGTGAALTDIVAGGPAEGGGLQAGDVVLSIDGKQIREFSDISRAVNKHQPGDHIVVKVRRVTGEVQTKQVTLGTRPQTSSTTP
jgi:putative serine protease PepD